jgi:hypothetical protein
MEPSPTAKWYGFASTEEHRWRALYFGIAFECNWRILEALHFATNDLELFFTGEDEDAALAYFEGSYHRQCLAHGLHISVVTAMKRRTVSGQETVYDLKVEGWSWTGFDGIRKVTLRLTPGAIIEVHVATFLSRLRPVGKGFGFCRGAVEETMASIVEFISRSEAE